ncbi:hypothetical protein EYF80_052755 [Liparis tanakae]|uniref:Uncharacterized protein n=1 Tax=Liparis tanakae TaxID=230148 RepID=A0A4Z2F890_9TELE|nr:hypothetical protein EYF80_052755 [Liparis tanakae]
MVEGDGVSAVVGFVGQQLREKLQQVYDTRERLEFPANALGEQAPSRAKGCDGRKEVETLEEELLWRLVQLLGTESKDERKRGIVEV